MIDQRLLLQTSLATKMPFQPCANTENDAAEFIRSLKIRPHFHPIIDLYSSSLLGFEVLSRGVNPPASPREIFAKAKRLGATWDLERTCRTAALQKIAELPMPFKSLLFFINVSPDIFSNARFKALFTLEKLQELGIDQRQIVIEITEETTSDDFEYFVTQINHYAGQGFKIALDDFGSGYSSLINLIASTPHYLKLDMAIVRDVHKHDYKQKLVKAMAAFASSVNMRMIAEGVECIEELDVLIRFGVRYVQGFIFGMPEPMPYLPSDEWRQRIRALVDEHDIAAVEQEERVGGLVIRPLTITKTSLRCKEANLIFKKQIHLDHVVILDGNEITGLLTRQHFYAETGGAFGYQLFQNKPIETVCKQNPLIVNDKTTVTSMAKLAMDRMPEDLYDPVLVVDSRGDFLGTITMKQLMTKSIELEVRSAMGTNPLTNLPGNNAIHRWIHEALKLPNYSIMYVDLDHFKGYNDTYGFLMGDEMLRFTADVLSQWLNSMPEGGRLGHIGGDDFVIVSKGIVTKDSLNRLCKHFDKEKLNHFKSGDIEKGSIDTMDRRGNKINIPLVTMSISVIDSGRIWNDPHPALFSEVAASLKKKVKQITAETGKSGFIFEERFHMQQ